MQVPFPLHPLRVAMMLDEGRRLALPAYPEVLDVDAVFGQVEVRLILRPFGGNRRKLVGLLVLVRDAVDEEEISDDHLFKAFQGLLLQRLAATPDLGPLNPRLD